MTEIKTTISEKMKAKGFNVNVIGITASGEEIVVISDSSRRKTLDRGMKKDTMRFATQMDITFARLRAKLAAKNSRAKTDSNLAG